MKTAFLCILLTLVRVASASEEAASTNTLLLENEYVKVTRITYPSGSGSGMHSHEQLHRVIYVIKGGTLKFVSKEMPPKIRTMYVKTGTVLFVPAQTHNVMNTGLDEVILLETQLKD